MFRRTSKETNTVPDCFEELRQPKYQNQETESHNV